MKTKQEEWKQRELDRLTRATAKARCIVCGERVSLEDRCSDGNYLHRACARGQMLRPER